MATIWIFSRHAVFGDFSTPKAKRCFGIKVRHWINLSYGTDFWSLPKLLTEICPFQPHFQAYFHFHGFSRGHFRTFFSFLHFLPKFQNPQPKNIHNSLFYSFQKGGEDFRLSSKPSNTGLLGKFSREIDKKQKWFFSGFYFQCHSKNQYKSWVWMFVRCGS